MKIEFRCDGCHRLLRVSDLSIGKTIACPACQSANVVPEEDGDVDEFDSQVEGVAGPRPAPQVPTPPGEELRESVWDPQPASLSLIFQDTWALYGQNLGMLVVVTLIDLLLWLFGLALIAILTVGTFAVLEQAVRIPVPLAFVAMLLVLLFGFLYLVNSMTCSQTQFFLKVARGEHTSIRDAFRGDRGTRRITMLPTFFGLLVLSGMSVLLIPGVTAYLLFWPYIWVWADRQTGGRDSRAFSLAASLSNRNIGTSLAISCIGIAMTFLGLSFFGYSLFGVLKAVAYLHMSGQEVTGLNRRPRVRGEVVSDEG